MVFLDFHRQTVLLPPVPQLFASRSNVTALWTHLFPLLGYKFLEGRGWIQFSLASHRASHVVETQQMGDLVNSRQLSYYGGWAYPSLQPCPVPCHFAGPLTRVDYVFLPFDLEFGLWLCFGQQGASGHDASRAWDVLGQLTCPPVLVTVA